MTFRNREDIRDLLDGNKKIDAIKYVRNLTNAKLLEAKQYVDSFVDDIPF
jgi:ribosomal protein L7/L12